MVQVLNAVRSILTRARNALPGRRSSSPLRPTDSFLVAYPRSGSTWVRMIISRILYPAERIQALSELDRLVPDMHRRIPSWPDAALPRVIKTHVPFAARPHQKQHDYGRIIYVVRHPCAVVSSYYAYLRAIAPPKADFSASAFVDRFLRGAVWPCSWQEHVLSWFTVRESRSMLVVRYEDLLDEPVVQIERIARFLDRPIGPEQAADVVEECSREKMVEMERNGSLVHDKYEFIRRDDARRAEAMEVGPELQARINDICSRALRTAGYEPAPIS